MSLKATFFAVTFCFLFYACSTDTPKSTEETVVQEEIQNLDSLNNQMDEDIHKMKENIEAVEAAINVLDNF